MPAILSQPKHVSILSGQAYTQEILESNHEERILECLHMPLATFQCLCQNLRQKRLLKDNRYTTIEHQVHIFIFICTTGSSNRTTQERFGHSPETISRIFRQVVEAINHLSAEYIQPVSAWNTNLDLVPPEIQNSTKLYPFFKDCIGAIDGSLVPLVVSQDEAAASRTRKGFTAQNVLIACNFDCTISYVLAGWEGSAHDSHVLADAADKGFTVPNGKYYLADAGYGISPEYLTPYRGVRYHLREQVLGSQAYVFTSSSSLSYLSL